MGSITGLALRLMQAVCYREAVVTSSPTLPLGGYVGYRRERGRNPIGVETDWISYPG